MEQKVVRKLESEMEKSIAQVFSQMSREQIPLLPSKQIRHLMAKAAVTVYEAAVEVQRSGG